MTDQSNLKIVVQRPAHALVRLEHPRVLVLDLVGRLTVAELVVEGDVGTGEVLSEQFGAHQVVLAGRGEVQQRVGVHQITGAFVAGEALVEAGRVRQSQSDHRGARLNGVLNCVPLALFQQKHTTANLLVQILEAFGDLTAAGVRL